METSDLILITEFCSHHNIDFAFIDSLNEFGLVDVIVVENNKYIAHQQLSDIEKMVRFHYELNINLEGIDAISNLLKQINDLQQELTRLKNKIEK